MMAARPGNSASHWSRRAISSRASRQQADGTLVAYMRDNGPAPKRLHISTSKDKGMTWSPVKDSDLPNPGSGADIVTLRNGHWVLAYNDTEKGRESLAVSLSTDEGKTWPHTRHLENGSPDKSSPSGGLSVDHPGRRRQPSRGLQLSTDPARRSSTHASRRHGS